MRSWRATNLTRDLTLGQRCHRLWTFLCGGGAYEHPDGHLELDFEEAAGIDSRNDPMQVQEDKLVAYERRKHQGNVSAGRILGACLLGFIAYSFAGRVGIEGIDGVGLGVMTAYGLYLLTHD
jgi:hypothetical protein